MKLFSFIKCKTNLIKVHLSNFNQYYNIYHGPFEKPVLHLKKVSFCTSLITIMLCGYKFSTYDQKEKRQRSKIYPILLLIIASVGTTLLLHKCTKGYIINIWKYKESDKYIAQIPTFIGTKKQFNFVSNDFQGLGKSNFGNIIIQNNEYFVHFKLPECINMIENFNKNKIYLFLLRIYYNFLNLHLF